MTLATSPLLSDLYQLNMLEAYLDHGQTETAVFEFFIRRLPARRGFLLAAGLEQALDYLENLRFAPEEIEWLAGTGRFSTRLIDYLANLRFAGDVHAMPEGTVCFANEPVLRVTAPLPQAQLVETRLINILHYQTLIASKAARAVLIAPNKLLVDFGLRRAHGSEAGVMAARASYLAGFAGTATVLAEERYGIPSFGTMAHSFIESYDDEATAFEHFATSRPNNLTLLIDTYDTLAAAHKVVALAPRLAARGIKIRSVRIDSGDLLALSMSVRTILDQGGLSDTGIFASGGLDEDAVADLIAAGAPLTGFGLGTALTTSSDAPTLDCVYKLQEYAGIARRKHSSGKATWPGRKQVWRRHGADGRMSGDVLSLEADRQPGEPLLVPIMRAGRRLVPAPSLADTRTHAARELARLPEPLRGLDPKMTYRVEVADALVRLAAEVDQRLASGIGKSGHAATR
jgi:nicotinate phosphoribosyltransferase